LEVGHMTTRRAFLKIATAVPILGLDTREMPIGIVRGALHHRQVAPTAAPVHGADVPLNEYERILATSNLFNTLGRPRSWSVVHQGFLPISPDRVLILDPKHLDGLADRWLWRDEQRHIRERMQEDASAESPSCQNGYRRRAAENGVSTEKLGLILWLTNELTRYYAASDWWEEWAYNMTYREALGSTGVGRHSAMPHQYQYDAKTYAATTIKTINAGVDWWLVLIPGGTKHWESLNDLPVHAMFTHVVAGPHSAGPGDQLRRWELGSRVARCFSWDSPNAFVELAQMDRVSAARLVNRQFVLAANDCPQAAR
jgi:hypothetical protein